MDNEPCPYCKLNCRMLNHSVVLLPLAATVPVYLLRLYFLRGWGKGRALIALKKKNLENAAAMTWRGVKIDALIKETEVAYGINH